MTLHFEATQGSAIDRQNGLKICPPRIVPMGVPDEMEFQYGIYRGDVRYDFECLCVSRLLKNDGCVTRNFTLNLGLEWTIDWLVELKQQLNILGDEFNFFVGFADGLVKTFNGQKDNHNENLIYSAITQIKSFEGRGISVPNDYLMKSNGDILLASIHIPMHPWPDSKS